MNYLTHWQATTSLLIVFIKARSRLALLCASLLCCGVTTTACHKSKNIPSDENPTTHSKPRERNVRRDLTPESVRNVIQSDQLNWESLRQERLQSLRELTSSSLVSLIRTLDPVHEANDRVILPDIFLALAENDPTVVIEMLKELPGEYYKTAMSEAFKYLARKNPEILQDYVLHNDFTKPKDRWMMIAACGFLGKDNPEKALEFFDQMSDEKRSGPLGTVLLQEAASQEPNFVVDFLNKNQNAPYFSNLLRDVLYTVLLTDPAFALEIASSYPEVENTNLSAGIYTSMARQDPKWALEEMTNASAVVRMEVLTRRKSNNRTYFSALFSEDPAKTIELLKGLIPGTATSLLFQEAANRLSNLPAGTVRDSSIRSFAQLIRPTDPETADRWMESIR